MGLRYPGPLTVNAGLFAGLPLAHVDRARTSWKVWVEDFQFSVLDATAFGLLGATCSPLGVVAGNTISMNTTHQRVIFNPGIAPNTGWGIQFNAASAQADYVNNRLNVPQSYGSLSTGMLGSGGELVWYSRVGLASNAATWDGAALIGWFVVDATIIDPVTGLPSTAANGGLGFHIAIDGTVTFVCDNAAITAAGTPAGTIVGQLSGSATDANFWELGFRMSVSDFTARNGRVQAFFGPSGSMVQVRDTTETGTLPTVNAGQYATTYAIVNGAAQQSDLFVESLLIGMSRTNN